jgi:hypothetical protein
MNTKHYFCTGLCALSFVVAACGAAPQKVRVTSKFTEEHAALFEDGIDFIADPVVLEGKWREDWQKEFEQRISLSDFVALARVATVRTDTDLEQRTTYRLVAALEKRLHGKPPKGDLVLRVSEEQDGYATVHGKQERILEQQFIAFVKWYETEEDEIAAHWHLSPASEFNVARVKELLKRRKEPERKTRVVIHRDN